MEHKVSRPPEVLENLRKVAVRMEARIELNPGRTTIGRFGLKDGRACYFLPSSLDINPTGAATLARNKDSAGYFMSSMGYNEAEFRQSWTRGHIKREFYIAVRDIFTYDNVVLVQRQAVGRDYRIVVLDGAVITACERRPLSVTGDGRSTIEELLREKKLVLEQRGQPSRIDLGSPAIKRVLKRRNLTLESILPEREEAMLADTANLMSGGEARDVTMLLHPIIARTAIDLTRDMGLYLSSVDVILDGDISEPNPFVILEINSAPGLDHFMDAHVATANSVEELYLNVMETFFRKHNFGP